MRKITLKENLFQGAISLERIGEAVKPWRIPYREKSLYPPNGLSGHAATPAGVRLSFVSDTDALRLHVAPMDQERIFDCIVDGVLVQSVLLPSDERVVAFDRLERKRKAIDIYLPQTAAVTIEACSIAAGASLELPADDMPRWVCYGSSITQCATAASPAETWPAIVAREQQLHLTCLGYRGNCQLEPMVARLVRDLPADFVSLCLGINVYGSNSMSIRTFRAMVIGFLKIVTETHRGIPIVVISPIVSPPREETANLAGLTLVLIRREIEAALEALRQTGTDHLHYFDGLRFFGPEYAGYLPDELHPDAEGYRIMGRRFQQWLEERGIRQQIKRSGENRSHRSDERSETDGSSRTNE